MQQRVPRVIVERAYECPRLFFYQRRYISIIAPAAAPYSLTVAGAHVDFRLHRTHWPPPRPRP